MKHEEIAEVLSVSVRTVAEDWSLSKKWLARELEREKDVDGRRRGSEPPL
jgi:hypothetical protein